VPETLEKTLVAAVIRQMPEGVIIAEAPGGRVLAVNASVERILGPGFDYKGFHEDGSAFLSHEWPLARSLSTGQTIEREDVRIVRADGTRHVIRASSAPIRDSDGAIIAAVVTFFDVTAERRERDALALLTDISALSEPLRADETLRRIASASVPKFADIVFVYIVDADGPELRRHEFAAADPEKRELVHEMWRRFPPTTGPLQAVLTTGKSQLVPHVEPEAWAAIENEEQRALLRQLGVRSVVNVAMRASGQTWGVMSFIRTSDDRAFDELDLLVAEELGGRGAEAVEKSRLFEREREQRVRAERSAERIQNLQALGSALATSLTMDAVADVVIDVLSRVLTASGIVLARVDDDEATLTIIRAIGYPSDTIERFRAMPLDSELPLTRALATNAAIWMRNREERVMAAPLLASVPTKHAAWAALPIELHGRALGTIGLSFAEPQPFADEERNFLMSIAGQCAIALERARLFESERNAREEAERASRAKDEFLAILSHELRTPMTTVIGWADFLKMTHAANKELIGPIDALRNSAGVQAKLVDDLLDVSRIIAGKLSVRRVDTELTGIVRGAVDDVRITAGEKGVALECNLPDEPLKIEGDPDRLRQIVTNLLVNAVKFTPAGGTVTVSVFDEPDAEVIEVKDTGEGITPEFLPHVFDRFRQASVGDSRRHSGLGLGLSIVEHLVHRHGGTVRAESEGVGRGARFTVRLPKFGVR
jgi:signal transduction histidine kinase